ncbi:MAG: hypothetical protein GOU98_04410 [Candidatus Altiarchaeota archaeon]|nr:hypothetical protein [Candidatus Altiarchaeota archaeon]
MEYACKKKSGGSSCGGIYGVGFIGALIYFIATSTSFWDGIIGILKALIWPAFAVYGLFGFLGL